MALCIKFERIKTYIMLGDSEMYYVRTPEGNEYELTSDETKMSEMLAGAFDGGSGADEPLELVHGNEGDIKFMIRYMKEVAGADEIFVPEKPLRRIDGAIDVRVVLEPVCDLFDWYLPKNIDGTPDSETMFRRAVPAHETAIYYGVRSLHSIFAAIIACAIYGKRPTAIRQMVGAYRAANPLAGHEEKVE